MRSIHQQRVEKFMELANQNLPEKPTLPDRDVRFLRANLILEECLETIKALGFKASVIDEEVKFSDSFEPDLIEIADGCADIKVVTTGTLSACGINDEELQREVDDNNLNKFGPGHSIREDGKLIKPPNHQPPNIQKILEEQ